MNQRSFLLGMLCLGLALSSCKKEGTNASKDLPPQNTREVVWKEIAQISAVSKFSKIDTLRVNQSIDKGELTVAKLRQTFGTLTDGTPIQESEYMDYTNDYSPSGVGCNQHLTFIFWNLRSRGYPSVYNISWTSGSTSGLHNLTYDGYDPIATYTFSSTGVTNHCTGAEGWANLDENIFGFHRNWKVETKVSAQGSGVWYATIKLTRIGI
ncbi:hypothetical protein [Longitalea luteola]|uniref:hypothetical protein n=1 Tax=Longitalea luteola TaxID=2812563 RepID=UPI001A977A55|nr:hypothetical protein [Longitalea luteola]